MKKTRCIELEFRRRTRSNWYSFTSDVEIIYVLLLSDDIDAAISRSSRLWKKAR